MEVTQAEIKAYQDSVNYQAEKGRQLAQQMVDAMYANKPAGWTYRKAREYAMQVIQDVLSVYGRNAAVLAGDFFQEMTGVSPTLYDGIDMEYVEDKVRYLIKMIVDHDAEGFKKGLADASNYYVRRQAYSNITDNCKHNGKRYARVPQGAETCAFCFMLASRGFVYDSEMNALGTHGYHDNCDCIAVPSDENTVIEGYDWRAMKERYDACLKSAGVSDGATGRERRNAVIREIRSRDWEWLYNGEVPEVTILENAKPTREELATADILKDNGYKVEFASDKTMFVAYEDVKDNRIYHRSEWDLATPEDGNAIQGKFEQSAGKAKNIVIDASDFPSYWTEERLLAEMKRCKAEKYGEWSYDSVIVILQDGTTRRL